MRSRPGSRWRYRCSRSHASSKRTAGCCSACGSTTSSTGPRPTSTRSTRRWSRRSARSLAGCTVRRRTSASRWPPSIFPTARSGAGCWVASRLPKCSTAPSRPRRAPSSPTTRSSPIEIHNVHERTLPVPADAVWRMLEALGGPDDRLWPRDRWPPITIDGGLVPGARGHHSFVRYTVAGAEPGRRVRFRLRDMPGMNGEHGFEVLPAGDGASVLRHVVDAEARGPLEVVLAADRRPAPRRAGRGPARSRGGPARARARAGRPRRARDRGAGQAAIASSRMRNFCTLPVTVIGKASTNFQ